MTKEVKEYLTTEKKQELEVELENLKSVKRKEIADAIEWAKSLGDLSENAEYSQARDDQARNESRISEIENILQNAVIADGPNTNNGISVGSTVVVKKSTGEVNTFTIVGSEEVDIEDGKISNESPLGIALIGKDKGDKVKFMTPRGEVEYKIEKID